MAWTRPGERVHRDDGTRDFWALTEAILSATAVYSFDINDITGVQRGPRVSDRSNEYRQRRLFRSRAPSRLGQRLRGGAEDRSARRRRGAQDDGKPPWLHVAKARNFRYGEAPITTDEIDLGLRTAPANATGRIG